MTKAKLIETLKDILQYPLPVYIFEGKKYVPFDNADYLRIMAKEVLYEEVDE